MRCLLSCGFRVSCAGSGAFLRQHAQQHGPMGAPHRRAAVAGAAAGAAERPCQEAGRPGRAHGRGRRQSQRWPAPIAVPCQVLNPLLWSPMHDASEAGMLLAAGYGSVVGARAVAILISHVKGCLAFWIGEQVECAVPMCQDPQQNQPLADRILALWKDLSERAVKGGA